MSAVITKQPILLEDIHHAKLQLNTTEKRPRVEGVFAICDVVTGNNRIYPAELFEKAIAELYPKIKEGKVFGHLDHPDNDARTKVSLASHIINDLKVIEQDGQKVVWGRATILDNEHGRQLLSIFEAGGSVGISSRGTGETVKNEEGYDVVTDYKLVSFDFVADPAAVAAYPKLVYENKNLGGGNMTIDEIKNKFPDLIDKIRDEIRQEYEKKYEEWKRDLKEEFERQLKNNILYAISQEKDRLLQQAKMETKDDVTAKLILSKIVDVLSEYMRINKDALIEDKVDDKIVELQQIVENQKKEIEESYKLISDLGKKYMFEKYVKGHPKEEEIKKELESVEFVDFDQYLNEINRIKSKFKSEAVEIKIEDKKEEVNVTEDKIEDLKRKIKEKLKKYAEAGVVEDAQVSEVHDIDKKLSDLKKKIEDKLKGIKAKVKSEDKDLMDKDEKLKEDKDLESYVIKRTDGHPARYKIRRLFEEGKITSKKEVDLLCESLNVNLPKFDNSGKGVVEQDMDVQADSDLLKAFGLSYNEFKKLAGI